MHSILIACVNYNSVDKLMEYLDSIQMSHNSTSIIIELMVLVGDNSEVFEKIDVSKYSYTILHQNNMGNWGYFGGINKAIELSKIDITSFDFFIISNVDIRISESFFKDLLSANVPENVGWVAPAIFSEKEKINKNPKTLFRPSLKQIRLLIITYKFPFLHRLYSKFFYQRKRRDIIRTSFKQQEIFAGHGSFIILTKSFLLKRIDLNYPCFLYGEELFLGELLYRYSLKTIYMPAINLYDSENVSTGKIIDSIKYKYQVGSLKYIYQLFKENNGA